MSFIFLYYSPHKHRTLNSIILLQSYMFFVFHTTISLFSSFFFTIFSASSYLFKLPRSKRSKQSCNTFSRLICFFYPTIIAVLYFFHIFATFLELSLRHSWLHRVPARNQEGVIAFVLYLKVWKTLIRGQSNFTPILCN